MNRKETYDPTCAFCRIARGTESARYPISSGKSWVAFFPTEPATRGHTIVIPRDHFDDFWDMPTPDAGDLAAAAVLVGRAIRDALQPQGMNLISSSGRVAEQTVYHVHLHVVPRWAGDDIDAIWPKESDIGEEPLESVAARIRKHFPMQT